MSTNQGSAPEATADPSETEGTGPLIGCDLPIEHPDVVAHNELVLSGWAAAPEGVSGVVVQIDDRVLHATYGLETPWVAETMPDVAGAGLAGYHLRIDTSGWEPGLRKVTVAAYDADGRQAAVRGAVEILPFEDPKYTTAENLAAVAEGKVIMWLEDPRIVEGVCDIELPVEINGWAYAEGGLDAVIVTVDGQASYQAGRPITRPDLLDEYGAAIASGPGFAVRLHPSECPPGRHTMTVVAVGNDGHAVGVSNDIVCHAEAPAAKAPPNGAKAQVEWMTDTPAPVQRDAEAPERYDPDEHRGSLIEAEHELRYRWAMAIAEDRSVLDAACGVGWGSALLAEAGAARVVGIDISEEALAEARRRTEGLAVELERGDLLQLPFDDATFDLVTCFEAIEHVTDPDLALEELRRVLRPDGVLLISTPRRQPRWKNNVHHVHEFTSGEFERALRGRFANVRMHRQQTAMASALLDDEALAVGDGLTDLGIDVRKLTESRPGGEGYTVAVASDGNLPELGRMSMLASPRALWSVLDDLQTWEDRTLLAEADAAASRAELNVAKMSQEGNVRALHDIEGRLRERADVAAARAELEQALETIAERDADLQRLSERLDAREQRLRVADEQLRETAARLASQEQSVSWRLTRPLRMVKGLGRRARSSMQRLARRAGDDG